MSTVSFINNLCSVVHSFSNSGNLSGGGCGGGGGFSGGIGAGHNIMYCKNLVLAKPHVHLMTCFTQKRKTNRTPTNVLLTKASYINKNFTIQGSNPSKWGALSSGNDAFTNINIESMKGIKHT